MHSVAVNIPWLGDACGWGASHFNTTFNDYRLASTMQVDERRDSIPEEPESQQQLSPPPLPKVDEAKDPQHSPDKQSDTVTIDQKAKTEENGNT